MDKEKDKDTVSSILYITEASASKEKSEAEIKVEDPSKEEIEEFFKSGCK